MRVACIGFGEVAAVFSAALMAHGADVAAYDVLFDREGGLETLQKRAANIRFCSLADALSNAEYVFSTVTTDAAIRAAQAAAPYLMAGQTYVDFNATAPLIKREIGDIIQASGAAFVEGAVLGAVGVSGAKTRILTGGAHGGQAATALSDLGLQAAFYSLEIGRASAFKMLRSIFSKGMEALLLEFLVAGERAGIREDLWTEVVSLFRESDFERIAENWICTHATAHERRCGEMHQVADVMRDLGLEPVVTAGTLSLFEHSCTLNFRAAFPKRPERMEEVIAFLEKPSRVAGHGSKAPATGRNG